MVFSLPPEPNTGVLKISSSAFTSRHGECLLYSYTVHGCTTTLVRYLPWKYWLDDQMVSHTYARELRHRFNDVKRPWMREAVIASVRPASSNNSVRAHKTIKSIPCFSDILSFYSDTFSFVDNRQRSLPKGKGSFVRIFCGRFVIHLLRSTWFEATNICFFFPSDNNHVRCGPNSIGDICSACSSSNKPSLDGYVVPSV